MITSIWNKVELHCGEHGNDFPLMDLELKNGQVFHVCKNDISDNGEIRPCRKKISLKDFEKLLDKITAILDEAELNNEIINLKHQTFTIGKIQYRVYEHDNDKIRVAAKFLY